MGRGKPCVPTKRTAPQQILHRSVGQGDGARIENDAGGIGVLEADGDRLPCREHKPERGAKRKARLLGTKKSGGAGTRNGPAGQKDGGPELEAALD